MFRLKEEVPEQTEPPHHEGTLQELNSCPALSLPTHTEIQPESVLTRKTLYSV